MVFIPGGATVFGGKRIAIQPFYLDAREVTNEEFLRFVKEHPQYASKMWSGGPDEPVAFVTWYSAKAYCGWQYKRLPTEVEWEFAAKAGIDGAEYPWGKDAPTPERANYGESKIGRPVRSGRYPANALGLYDMAGNVWEFTADTWSEDPSVPAPDSPGTRKVIKGASFGGAATQLRISYRDSHRPDDPVAHVGFRCAR